MTDSSLRVDDALVDRLCGRTGILDDVVGNDVDQRRALIRYTAAIDARRDSLVPTSPRDELVLKFLSESSREIAQAAAFPNATQEHPPMGLSGSDLMERFPVVMFSKSKSTDIIDVPALRIVTGAWNANTISIMMALDDDQLREKLPQEVPDLMRIEGTDLYFCLSGNHRVLGHQWLGDETIRARVKTLELEPERFGVNERGIFEVDGRAFVGPEFGGRVDRNAQNLLADLGVRDLGRGLADG